MKNRFLYYSQVKMRQDVGWFFRSGDAEWREAKVANLKGSQVQPIGLNRDGSNQRFQTPRRCSASLTETRLKPFGFPSPAESRTADGRIEDSSAAPSAKPERKRRPQMSKFNLRIVLSLCLVLTLALTSFCFAEPASVPDLPCKQVSLSMQACLEAGPELMAPMENLIITARTDNPAPNRNALENTGNGTVAAVKGTYAYDWAEVNGMEVEPEESSDIIMTITPRVKTAKIGEKITFDYEITGISKYESISVDFGVFKDPEGNSSQWSGDDSQSLNSLSGSVSYTPRYGYGIVAKLNLRDENGQWIEKESDAVVITG